MGKVYLPFFGSFLLLLEHFSFLQEDWALGYHSMKIDNTFLIFSNFLRP